jgi:hypothetical protein
MSQDVAPKELLGRIADDSLLDPASPDRPASLGSPAAIPEHHGPSLVVGIGVALAAVTLIGGIALAALGVVALTSHVSVAAFVELWAGILLCATHWGWVHVAAWLNDRRRDQSHQPVIDQRRAWLEAIEPYPRHEVATRVAQDGSLTIEKHCFRPVGVSNDRFRFERETELTETYPADEPAAAIAERAELLRHQAAAATARARQRYEAASHDRELARLRGQDELEQLEARRVTSEALSEQLNANLREPPLVE